MAQPFDIFIMAEGLPKEARENLGQLGKLYIKKTKTAYSPEYLMEKFGIDQRLREEIIEAWRMAGFISRRRNDFIAVIRSLSQFEREVLKLID